MSPDLYFGVIESPDTLIKKSAFRNSVTL